MVERTETRGGVRPFARLDYPRSDEPTRLAILSDLHFTTTESGTSKQLHRTDRHLGTAIEDIERRDVDAVVCLGDLVQGGRRTEFDRLRSRLDRLDPPVCAVPGNHDLDAYDRAEGIALDEFAATFSAGSLPFARPVGGLVVLGLPAVDRRLDPENVDRVLEAASPAATVLCLHYPLSAAVETLREAGLPEGFVRPPIDDRDLYDRLPAGTLVCTGHLHLPLVAAETAHTEVVAPPLCTYPQGYLLLSADSEGATLEFVPVADPETMAETRRARASHSETDRWLTNAARDVLHSLPVLDRRRPSDRGVPYGATGDEHSPQ